MAPSTTTKRIGTHNGSFHCDEALACNLLRRTSQYSDAEIVRTRDPKILDTLDIVVDVGGVYDLEKRRFDHHQREFQGTFDDDTSEGDGKGRNRFTKIRLSSAGLVYKCFGKEVIGGIVKGRCEKGDGGEAGTIRRVIEDDKVMEVVWRKVYESFIQGIDAIDNGIEKYDGKDVGEARYEVGTDLSSRVGRLNGRWNEECTDETQMEGFEKAMKLAGSEFEECVLSIVESWLPAREIVDRAMKTRFDHDAAGRILVMSEWAPWKDHLYRFEEEENASRKNDEEPKLVYYVIYKDMTGSSWRVQGVAVAKGSFESRKALPVKWRGVRDENLSKISGIEGCVFCHQSGFIGGNRTFEGALQMARASLDSSVK